MPGERRNIEKLVFVMDDYDMREVDTEAARSEMGEEPLEFYRYFRPEFFRESFYEDEDGRGKEDGVELGITPGSFY